MGVQLTIPYETLVKLVEQLPATQQKALLAKLSEGETTPTTATQRLANYHANIDSTPLREEPSIRREDWYDDDGR